MPIPYLFVVYAPIPILAFYVFNKQTRNPAWAGLLTVALIGGTSIAPMLVQARQGFLGQFYHLTATTGQLLILADLFGRRRIWPSLIGLTIAVWSRQFTLLYAPVILWCAWTGSRNAESQPARDPTESGRAETQAARAAAPSRRLGMLILTVIWIGLIVLPTPILNTLRFDSPFESGYGYMYAGRGGEDTPRMTYEKYGLFSIRAVPDNAWLMHLECPEGFGHAFAHPRGTSLWYTSPFLLLLFPTIPLWGRDRLRAALMAVTLLIMFAILCYHSPGFYQNGYFRYTLDFVPVWMAVIAPWTVGGRGDWRRWFTLATLAWSLIYFQSIVPELH